MKVLSFFIAIMLLIPGVFAEELCYEGKKDHIYNELLDRGYTLNALTLSCKNILINSEERIEVNPEDYPAANKLICVNTPPLTGCASNAHFELVKLESGTLEIEGHGFLEELDGLEIYRPDKRIMASIGYYNGEPVVYTKRCFPFFEYYAFDITKSEKLMDTLFPRSSDITPPAVSDEDVSQNESGVLDKDTSQNESAVSDEDVSQDNENFLHSLLLAAFFGLILNIPLCVIIFASGSLEDENKGIVKQFLIGRALGLLAIGLLFVGISSYFAAYFAQYNHSLNIGFGVICVGLAYTTYHKKQSYKKAFGYTGGFIKGFMPCAKLTPVFPLLIGLSMFEGALLMLVFILSSTLYFFIIFFFGRKIILKLVGRTNKMITTATFLMLGLYFIYRGMEVFI